MNTAQAARTKEGLLQLACLNVMAKEMPHLFKHEGRAAVGRHIITQPERINVPGPIAAYWVTAIRAEYRELDGMTI